MGWETSATEYYKLCGLDINTYMVFNSGVLVMQPKLHNAFLVNTNKQPQTNQETKIQHATQLLSCKN